MRNFWPGLLYAATLGAMLVGFGALSGCDNKPADGTVIVNDAPPLTEEKKAAIRKYYPDRSKKGANKGGN